MSEHEPIDVASYKKLLSESDRQLSREERDRVDNHLMYGYDHRYEGYEVMYGGRGTPELEDRFENHARAHLSAILRGEVTMEDLWKGSVD